MTNRDISEEIAAAMKYARERCGMTPEQFAREVNRVAGPNPTGYPNLDANFVEMIEAGEMACFAEWLVAAARIAEQPVSAILGELDMYEGTIPRLERRLAALEEKLERAGLS